MKYPWVDEDGCKYTFTTVDEVTKCLKTIMEKANVYDKWAEYKQQIDSAKTLEELEKIKIEY